MGRMAFVVKSKRIVLPENDTHWEMVSEYAGRYPDRGYHHAPSHSVEAFRDMKYGVRIHWGLYSLTGAGEESWPFLKMTNRQRQAYQQLYKEFDPVGFDAGEWMKFFCKAGFRCFTFTAKHHDGFSLFDTDARIMSRAKWDMPDGPAIEECDLRYSIMDSPYKRDIVAELCEAAETSGIKTGLYFSHPDWYDADFRPYCYHPLQTPQALRDLTDDELNEIKRKHGGRNVVFIDDATKKAKKRMIARHRKQLTELVTKYGKIDMLCLDMWLGPDIWPEIKQTIKMIRKLQPDAMIRARGIGNYGDYYTPEGFIPGSSDNTGMPWMVIYPLGRTFSYETDWRNYKGSGWIIKSLVETVAKGGNFMVGIGPDRYGHWHPEAVRQLEEAGEWLEENKEAIFFTDPGENTSYKEGENLYFTYSKRKEHLYAIHIGKPKGILHISSLRPPDGSSVWLLGRKQPLPWTSEGIDGVDITIPGDIPEKAAYVFSIRSRLKG